MTSPGQDTINKRLFEALQRCPSCGADILTAKADDGLPSSTAYEVLFECGARVQIEDDGEYHVNTGCPSDLQRGLSDLHESVIADLEEEYPPC